MSRRTAASVLATAALTLLLAGCSGGSDDADAPAGTPSASPTPTPTPSPAAALPKPPGEGACYRLDYAEAVAPTVEVAPTPCKRKHTSKTFAVGALDAVVDGHLLAVDSKRVRNQVAQTCPARFAEHVGGTEDDRRLSMLRSVWFTPTVEQSDAGESWYRCDAVALAGDERLAPLAGPLKDVLDDPDGRDRYAMCGTAEPGTSGFERVICSADHSWRAVATVPFDAGRYPGVGSVRTAGDGPCKSAGADAADGALDYRWGYEWPTAAQWRAGQTYGLCWVPDR
ncbi:septum formation family protein [Nocardioides sp. URHA0020]|uniref:septum formation family protein n=1 Tax=Nocardioides sp. URHA0020 TaxID=1380392 RepID=UPI000491D05F|nr:septum formation family protein [Nocardioides sp. URHA0020]